MDIRQLTDKCEAGTIIRLLAIRHRCAEGTIRNHLKRQDFTPHHIWERKGTGGITQTKLEQSIKMKIIT
jgi:hypothetical protein